MILEIRDEVISLSGTLLKNQWATLESAMAVRLRHHPAGVVLDLGGLTQVSPEGAQTFREAAAHVTRVAPGARLMLANVPGNVQRVLRQSDGLSSGLAIAGTVAEARASLAATADMMGTTNSETSLSLNGKGAIEDSERHPIVLVGLLGTAADEHAVAVACRLAASVWPTQSSGEATARVYMAYVLTVPRDRSLLAPVGEEEETGVKRLKQFAAAAKATGYVASVVTQVERTRDGGIRLTDLANDLRATFVVLALGANASAEEIALARYVVEKAPCEVIVNRVPLSDLRSSADAGINGKEK